MTDPANTPQERIEQAIDLGVEWGRVCGEHHKMWVIDQMIRVLAGDDYEDALWERDPEGMELGEWDTGIAP